MDVMMPEMDGMEACEKIREIPELKDTIITFLTARSEDYSQVAGFEVGADDYIAKPIKPKLLVSKVKGLLRRLKDTELENSETLTVGNLQINREEYKIIKDGVTIVLPRKEFELLYLLASKPGKVFTRAEILDKVWGNEVIVGGRTIDVHIRKLREKIDEDVFKTIKGVGYKIELTDAAKDFIADKGYDEKYGARPLRRSIQKYLEDPIAEEIINSNLQEGDTLLVDFDANESKIIMKVNKKES
jgi:two-component system alkaline phosphatase synthesis response regulator PhoP